MNKQFIYLTSILVLAMAAAVAVSAQESNATANNATLNNTTLNSTPLNDTTQDNATGAPLNLGAESQTTQNLSTVNGKPIVVAPISEMAGVAPLVAAGAASAQVASEPADSFKIGTGVGGSDPFNPKHVEIEALQLGIPIKSMRDTGKMFFVCDIV